MDQVLKPKTARGKRKLLQKEPKVHEDAKSCVFIRSSTINRITVDAMKDLFSLKKPFATFCKQRNKDIRPFEDTRHVEFLARKNDCNYFVVGSNSKKRPNNLIVGRTFDHQVSDIFELGIEEFKQMRDFGSGKIDYGAKPLLLFTGQEFDELDEMKRLKNLFIDFFTGPKLDGLRLSGVQHVFQIIALNSKIHFRCYKIDFSSNNSKYVKLNLEEMGPRIDLNLRRFKLASDDLLKKSLKKPAEVKVKKVKNIKRSKLGTTFGRLHMNRQDYSRLQTRKMKGLSKRKTSTE